VSTLIGYFRHGLSHQLLASTRGAAKLFDRFF
jgi:hypothetical protein